MRQINHYHASYELCKYIESLCPNDAHMHVNMRGVWVTGNPDNFTGQFKADVTTKLTVVRAFTYNGVTYWTCEKWEHDNGYRCTLQVLDKSEFLALIRA